MSSSCPCGGPDKCVRNGTCRKCKRGGAASRTPAVDSVTERGDERDITKTTHERVRTLEDLVRICAIDTAVWDVVEWRAVVHEMGAIPRATGASKNWQRPSTQPIITPLYSVSAKLRKKVAVLAVRADIERMKAEAKMALPPLKALVRRGPLGEHMLQIAIPDVHMGKLAWKAETGANYDLKIAERLFETALERLIERTAHHHIGRVLFVVGSDLLHTDNPNGTTTRGTPQDTEGRFHKTFWKTRQMVTRCIERLRAIAPVDVLMVPGNHDNQTVWHLGDSLECWYHDCGDVTIDNAPTQRKYYEHGKVMLLFTHGDKGKKQDYPLLMATEQPEMFGRTVHREAHTGHIHQLQVREQHGVRVRVSPALCAADAWHAENQYVGNARAAEAFVWHPVEGLISQATWTVPSAGDE